MSDKAQVKILGFVIPKGKAPTRWIRLGYITETSKGKVLYESRGEGTKLADGELEKMMASSKVSLLDKPVFGNGERGLVIDPAYNVYLANLVNPASDAAKEWLGYSP